VHVWAERYSVDDIIIMRMTERNNMASINEIAIEGAVNLHSAEAALIVV
jgi:hypothetical protein